MSTGFSIPNRPASRPSGRNRPWDMPGFWAHSSVAVTLSDPSIWRHQFPLSLGYGCAGASATAYGLIAREDRSSAVDHVDRILLLLTS